MSSDSKFSKLKDINIEKMLCKHYDSEVSNVEPIRCLVMSQDLTLQFTLYGMNVELGSVHH